MGNLQGFEPASRCDAGGKLILKRRAGGGDKKERTGTSLRPLLSRYTKSLPLVDTRAFFTRLDFRRERRERSEPTCRAASGSHSARAKCPENVSQDGSGDRACHWERLNVTLAVTEGGRKKISRRKNAFHFSAEEAVRLQAKDRVGTAIIYDPSILVSHFRKAISGAQLHTGESDVHQRGGEMRAGI